MLKNFSDLTQTNAYGETVLYGVLDAAGVAIAFMQTRAEIETFHKGAYQYRSMGTTILRDQDRAGFRDYVEDRARRPYYDGGQIRKGWHALGPVERESWTRRKEQSA